MRLETLTASVCSLQLAHDMMQHVCLMRNDDDVPKVGLFQVHAGLCVVPG